MKEIIEFKSAKLGYGKKIIFNALSLKIYEGDFIGIIGPNGSGKTTFLRSILGLLNPQNGKIIREKNVRFGYCTQRQFIDTIFPFTSFEIVMMARAKMIGPLRRGKKLDKEKVFNALKTTGILNLAHECFYGLSGGQKQRVLLARALVLEPEFLVLDEPTADLDIKTEREIIGLIKALHTEKKITVALVTHELNEVINSAQKFIFLNKKAPHKIFTRDELNEQLLSEIFESEIKLTRTDERLTVL